MQKAKDNITAYLGLFSSASTLLCCALPIIFVSLGMGATFASITANFPFMIFLAKQSIALFTIATTLLLLSGYLIFTKTQLCPADKNLAQICKKTKKINKIIWYVSAIILLISFFFKYILILFI